MPIDVKKAQEAKERAEEERRKKEASNLLPALLKNGYREAPSNKLINDFMSISYYAEKQAAKERETVDTSKDKIIMKRDGYTLEITDPDAISNDCSRLIFYCLTLYDRYKQERDGLVTYEFSISTYNKDRTKTLWYKRQKVMESFRLLLQSSSYFIINDATDKAVAGSFFDDVGVDGDKAYFTFSNSFIKHFLQTDKTSYTPIPLSLWSLPMRQRDIGFKLGRFIAVHRHLARLHKDSNMMSMKVILDNCLKDILPSKEKVKAMRGSYKAKIISPIDEAINDLRATGSYTINYCNKEGVILSKKEIAAALNDIDRFMELYIVFELYNYGEVQHISQQQTRALLDKKEKEAKKWEKQDRERALKKGQ